MQFNAGFVGVAVKQLARTWSDAFAVQATIDAGEPYFLITKGVVQVPNTGISANVKGDAIYMTNATSVLTPTGPGSGTVSKVGRIVEVAGSRGTPAGRVRIDLDTKDSFV
jgi:predicted RecA/RadA family phage recombinase